MNYQNPEKKLLKWKSFKIPGNSRISGAVVGTPGNSPEFLIGNSQDFPIGNPLWLWMREALKCIRKTPTIPPTRRFEAPYWEPVLLPL